MTRKIAGLALILLLAMAPYALMSFAGPRSMWTEFSKAQSPPICPWSSPTKFEFMINLKTAKQIGLTIPPIVLARADKVIK